MLKQGRDMKFKSLLQQFRQRNGLTQEKAARLLTKNLKPFEVTARSIRNYEQEEREPSIPVRQAIENAIKAIEK